MYFRLLDYTSEIGREAIFLITHFMLDFRSRALKLLRGLLYFCDDYS